MKYTKIYLITNKITNRQYVGYTNMTIEHRFYFHSRVDSQCSYLANSINKYGKENFNIQELCGVLNDEYIGEMEQYFIDYYQTLAPKGYNLKDGGYNGKMSDVTKNKMSKSQIKKWQTQSEDACISQLVGINDYVRNKRKKVIGVNILDGSILKFETIQSAIENGYYIHDCLSEKTYYANGYTWFYQESKEDGYYVELAINRLGGFGKHKKNKTSWNNPESRKKRIDAVTEGNKKYRKPIIGVNRFDLTILEFEGIHLAEKAGYNSAGIGRCLNRKNQHAYDYCWFYKTTEDINYYIEEAKKILGNKLYNRKVKAVHVDTGEVLVFNNLGEAKDLGFAIKRINTVLRGEYSAYKKYKWSYF